MKKFMYVLALLSLWTIQAQETTPVHMPKFHIGVKAGATNSNVTVDWNNLSELPKQKWGYQFGLVTKYDPLTWLDFNGSLDFLQKGFVIPDRLPSVPDVTEYVEAFGNLLQFGFDMEVFPFEDFGINIGPYLAYWETGKAIMEVSGDSISPQTIEYVVQGATSDLDPENLDENVLLINPWDFGISGGLSYNLGKLGLSVKYEIGLSDLNNMANALKESSLFKFDGTEPDKVSLPPTKFRTLSFTLVYWFN